jgi:hypothetical protein
MQTQALNGTDLETHAVTKRRLSSRLVVCSSSTSISSCQRRAPFRSRPRTDVILRQDFNPAADTLGALSAP